MMGLREIASQDLNIILSDKDAGFGWDILLTNPQGQSVALVGYSNDIGKNIDPETGVPVSGRLSTIAISMQKILEAGFEFPVSIADSSAKPWIVEFNDINGLSYKFKIAQTFPDRSLGILECKLEAYR